MNADNVIEVAGLHQRYGEFEAVRDVSFEVREGELFALLGTNGAGKTTTMETVEGFRPAHSGTVRVLGRDPHRERRAVRPHVGIMLQEGGLFPDLTVAETVDLWRDIVPGSRPRDEVLEQVDLADKAGVRTRQLSGGQKRRLDLALAVVARPRVLFLDEPTTGMDPEARRTTWRTVRGLVADGATVLLTTHYLEEAEQLADRLAIMHRGEIRVAGTVAEVLAGHGDRIDFRIPPQVAVADLPRVGGAAPRVSATSAGPVATYVLTGRSVQAALRELLDWADAGRLELAGLRVRSASLEDVFLQVAGHPAVETEEANR
ncbi:ABC transporter ATP-binding protein [Thermomonospora cellulosilytica]|uniref:ABC-2 type transport system ATP-binding protein n=1 Tax=Thermomonospora cellulosilytica TaxID=1411118 RepID=A0A7W3RBA6_9ACTN|nr:ABC transporter ATP-binding protein [Thermomonospora cellulosilytica]MBA9006539.1 ABC-2 type transport system ATP-binding protein [Thermomonospora cellulosilytica]